MSFYQSIGECVLREVSVLVKIVVIKCIPFVKENVFVRYFPQPLAK